MSNKEFLIDATAQFLQSSTWLDAVADFLETHFRKFLVLDTVGGGGDVDAKTAALDAKASDDAEHDSDDAKSSTTQSYSLEQFDTFLLFKDLVERLLEQVIADLGCSGDDLVSVLEKSARLGTQASSERQFFIQTLLSFESYSAFHRKISRFAAEKLASGAVVLEQTAEETESDSSEYSEWVLQLAIAHSILASMDRGELDVAEEALVPWAQALVEMDRLSADLQVETECTEWAADGNEKTTTADPAAAVPDDSRIQELERTLIRERLKVDLLVAQRVADANAQMKQQMLHLVAAEVANQTTSAHADELHTDTATAAETELAALLTQFETIASRLTDVKASCFAFTNIAQPEMDLVYLFLKEKVHYAQDLVANERAIADFVFAHIDERDAAVVPLLLEWLLLEAEGLRVQHQIQDQLHAARDDDGHWAQAWDDASNAFYYVHSVTNESTWTAPVGGYVDMNGQVVGPSWDGYDESSSSVFGSRDDTSEASRQTYEDSLFAGAGDDSSTDTIDVPSQRSAHVSLNEAASHLDATLMEPSVEDASQLLEFESIMRRIAQEHDDERRRLELLFQIEKARQQEALRKRKEKKRCERLAKKTAAVTDADAKSSRADERTSAAVQRAPPPPQVLSPQLASPMSARTAATRAEAKDNDAQPTLSVMVPGHGRVNLMHLLGNAHARRFQERKDVTSPQQQAMLASAQTLLNPSTLRYLTEKMIAKDPTHWRYAAPTHELVMDESEHVAADAK